MFKILQALLVMAVLVTAAPSFAKDGVVLLHGIGRTKAAMADLEKAFAAQGYDVLNIDYPSRKDTLGNLAAYIHPQVEDFTKGRAGCLHFVGYSMGGLLTRAYINAYKPKKLCRVVFLGVPQKGSEVADLLKDNFLFDSFYGKAGQELVTNVDNDEKFGKITYEAASIAGTWTIDPVSYFIISGPNDGKVSVASTKVDGLKSHLILPVTHTFMPSNKAVIEQSVSFIKDGKFKI